MYKGSLMLTVPEIVVVHVALPMDTVDAFVAPTVTAPALVAESMLFVLFSNMA